MKRNFLTALFMALVFSGGMVADAAAADITFGGQLRPRFEVFEQNDFNDNTDATFINSVRVRLNVNAKINDKTSAFIQMQARGVYGAGQAGTVPSQAGMAAPLINNRNSAAPSDAVTDVGLHQAYFTLNDFFNMPVDLKIGRQEIVLDGHRLFGNTGWTQGAQSHDALRIDHHHGEHTLSYMFISATESAGAFPTTIGANAGGAPAGQAGFGGLFGTGLACANNIGDGCDRNEHVFWANMKGILGGALSLYFIATDDDSYNTPTAFAVNTATPGAATAAGMTADNNIYTLGFRQAGQMFGIDYRGEFYYQFGEAEGISGAAGTPANVSGVNQNPFSSMIALGVSNPNGGTSALGNRLAAASAAGTGAGNSNLVGAGSGVDRSAYMAGIRVGKTFNNVMWKPSATIWYDYVSGTDLDDVADGDWGTFDTLYDTGHKFYGYMDTYLNPNGADTAWLGLQDLAGKFSIKPMAKLTLKADIHAMWTAVDAQSDLNDLGYADNFALNNTGLTVGDVDGHLGEELDLTAVYKYDPNTTISIGYSHFWADDTFHTVNGRLTAGGVGNPTAGSVNLAGSGNDDDANWAYIQFDVKF